MRQGFGFGDFPPVDCVPRSDEEKGCSGGRFDRRGFGRCRGRRGRRWPPRSTCARSSSCLPMRRRPRSAGTRGPRRSPLITRRRRLPAPPPPPEGTGTPGCGTGTAAPSPPSPPPTRYASPAATSISSSRRRRRRELPVSWAFTWACGRRRRWRWTSARRPPYPLRLLRPRGRRWSSLSGLPRGSAPDRPELVRRETEAEGAPTVAAAPTRCARWMSAARI